MRGSSEGPSGRRWRAARLCLAATLAAMVVSCGQQDERETDNIKEQVQVAYGNKQFAKGLELSQKGLALAREKLGDKAPSTLYFAQAIEENEEALHNDRAAIPALKLEIQLRVAAGQREKKIQFRRTTLIKLAEETDDRITAAEQAVAVARGIAMGPGKSPQPVYRAETPYPVEQYRDHVEGDVQIAFGLDAGGAVTEAHVTKATPPTVFDEAALDSFRKWRFTPMLDQSGQPVSASGFSFTLAFRMRKGS